MAWHPSCQSAPPPTCTNRLQASGGGIAGGSCKPTRLEAVQADTMTPGQQALRVARQRIQTARADVEVCQVVRTLAIALGASRAETGTIKALHSVLLLLERPRMSCEEACASTGASRSNFTKWHRKVRHAQLDSPPPSWRRFHPRRPTRPRVSHRRTYLNMTNPLDL